MFVDLATVKIKAGSGGNVAALLNILGEYLMFVDWATLRIKAGSGGNDAVLLNIFRRIFNVCRFGHC